ncbi:putative integral membrane protein [Xylaria sp. FL1042]|nr:putative integral membrane protein [Xylaria sp. FL1042]
MAASDPRARIMAHMNKEHSDDLKRYLQAFNGLSSSAASAATLTDLTFDALTIQSASGIHSVPITPPMKSFADARVRLVDMAERAQAQLGGLSDVRVNIFEGPRGGGLLSFLGVSFYLVSAAALALGVLRPGTAAWRLLGAYFPYKGAEGFAWSVRTIAVPVAVIHFTEAWWMAHSRLAKYGVQMGSRLWFLWVLETFVEGFPAIRRFDGIVAEERRKKEAAAKH